MLRTSLLEPTKNSQLSVIGDIAPACIEAIRAYNDNPNIVSLNAAHGTTNVLNYTAVWVYGISFLPMMSANRHLSQEHSG